MPRAAKAVVETRKVLNEAKKHIAGSKGKLAGIHEKMAEAGKQMVEDIKRVFPQGNRTDECDKASREPTEAAEPSGRGGSLQPSDLPEVVDEASDESFPASDPPAWTPSRTT